MNTKISDNQWKSTFGHYLLWLMFNERESDKTPYQVATCLYEDFYGGDIEEVQHFFDIQDGQYFTTPSGVARFFEMHWEDEVTITCTRYGNKGGMEHEFSVDGITLRTEAITEPFDFKEFA